MSMEENAFKVGPKLRQPWLEPACKQVRRLTFSIYANKNVADVLMNAAFSVT